MSYSLFRKVSQGGPFINPHKGRVIICSQTRTSVGLNSLINLIKQGLCNFKEEGLILLVNLIYADNYGFENWLIIWFPGQIPKTGLG